MYGLIGKMVAASGKRAELITLLLAGIQNMRGCLSYVVAQDPGDENAIWITEVWDSKENHDSSLTLPQVKKTITAARPIIAGFDHQVVTAPVGGVGLPNR